MAGPTIACDGPMAAVGDVERALRALAERRSVIVTGTWGSGKSQLAAHLARRASTDVVIVDDVERCDRATAMAVADRIGVAVPVVVTVTRGANVPSPIRRRLSAIAAESIELAPLTVEAADGVIANCAHAQPDAATLAFLHESAGGVLRLLVAMLEDGLAGGWLTVKGGALHGGAEAEPPPGPRVRDAARGLIDVVPSPARLALAALGAAGPLPVPVADAHLPTAGLDLLERIGVVEELHVGPIRDVALVAPVLGAAIRALVTPRRRRLILREVVDGGPHLDDERLTYEQRIRIAHWAVAVDGPVTLVRRGIRPAVVLGNPAAAVAFGRHVLAVAADDAAVIEDTAMALEAMGDHPGAAALLSSAVRAGSPSVLARVATNLYLAGHELDTARRMLTPPADHDVAANLAWLELSTGDVATAERTASGVLMATDASEQARVWAAFVAVVGGVLAGRDDRILATNDLAAGLVDIAAPRLTPYARFQVDWPRAFALIHLGAPAEAVTLAERGAATTDDAQVASAWHALVALVARERGDVMTADARLAMIEASVVGDPFGLATWAASERAVCRAMAGDGEIGDPSTDGVIGYFAPLLERNAAWCAAASGVDERAIALIADASRTAHRLGQATQEAACLVDLARFGRPRDALVGVDSLARLDNPIIRRAARMIAALATREHSALIAAAAEARAVGWLVVEQDLLLEAYDALLRRRDLVGAARLELLITSNWPTPIRRRRMTTPLLTGREVQVGRLAVAGETSVGIAERLGISRRTVDNLLNRVYVKCDVHGRRQLAAAVAGTSASSADRDRRRPSAGSHAGSSLCS